MSEIQMLKMNRNIRILSIIFVAVLSIAFLMLLFIWFENNYYVRNQIPKEAEHWKNLAENETQQGLTLEEAYKWLKNHNFDVLFWNPHDEKEGWIGASYRDKAVIGHLVRGSKRLNDNKLFSKPVWIDLTFWFDSENKFDNITSEIRTYQIPK